MLKILIPVDGSESSRRAAKHVVDLAHGLEPVDIHILNVQPPIMSGQVRMFVGQDVIEQYHKEESALALKPVRELLDHAGVTYTAHSAVGHSRDYRPDRPRSALRSNCHGHPRDEPDPEPGVRLAGDSTDSLGGHTSHPGKVGRLLNQHPDRNAGKGLASFLLLSASLRFSMRSTSGACTNVVHIGGGVRLAALFWCICKY
jgi:hypothetical protein